MGILRVAYAGNISFINSVLCLSNSSSKLFTDSSPYPESETEETGETYSRVGVSSVSVVRLFRVKKGQGIALPQIQFLNGGIP